MVSDENDFRELRDAWQNAPQPATVSRERVMRRAESVNRRLYRTTVLLVTGLCAEIIVFGVLFARAHDVAQRVGAVITCLGMTYLIYQVWANFRIVRHLQARMAGDPSLVFYRAFLDQMRVWTRGRWFWLRWAAIAPGPIIFVARDVHHYPEALWVLIVYVMLLLIAIPLNVVLGVRIVDRRIAELDRLTQDT